MKRRTVAALTFYSDDGEVLTLSTTGTKAAPGSKIIRWSIDWGDDIIDITESSLPQLLNHKHKESGSYELVLTVEDNKGGKAEDKSTVFITRNPTNPPPIGPNITFVSPNSGLIGSSVQLIGYQFGAVQGSSTVTFNGISASVISWSDKLITCTIPNTNSGPIIVTVGGIQAVAFFTVTSPEIFDFYVSTTGNDSWNGLFPTFQGSLNGPKQTITGPSGGISLLSAGKSLGIRGGIYEETITSVPSGTSWSNKVRIANYNGEIVTLHANGISFIRDYCIRLAGSSGVTSYVEFDGINCDASDIVRSRGNYRSVIDMVAVSPTQCTHHIRFKNLEAIAGTYGGSGAVNFGEHVNTGGLAGFHELINVTIHGGGITTIPGCDFECQEHGVYIKCRNNLIEHCNIYDIVGIGIQAWNPSGTDPATGNVFRYNRIHDFTRNGGSGSPGILFSTQGSDNYVYCNLIYNLRFNSEGIAGFNSPSGNKIWFNTIYNCIKYGIFIPSSCSNWEIRDNIMYENDIQNFLDQGVSTIKSNNSFDGTNPQFVNPGAGNFHLTVSTPGSIVNAGIAIPTLVNGPPDYPESGPLDFDGVFRDNPPDIGAYELV